MLVTCFERCASLARAITCSRLLRVYIEFLLHVSACDWTACHSCNYTRQWHIVTWCVIQATWKKFRIFKGCWALAFILLRLLITDVDIWGVWNCAKPWSFVKFTWMVLESRYLWKANIFGCLAWRKCTFPIWMFTEILCVQNFLCE